VPNATLLGHVVLATEPADDADPPMFTGRLIGIDSRTGDGWPYLIECPENESWGSVELAIGHTDGELVRLTVDPVSASGVWYARVVPATPEELAAARLTVGGAL
jgi:hypothetical protein